ncbi:hypothetical protein NZK35_17865 [Stieleria sp. ICT_E10.1]|uniref:hypothetical protein n=1 Tax=Stieleria sedimenti TaxID=2976331 RepID=UPI00217FE1B9|nr:hypothetical protein [Stieleria sedimenti]MCS7468523.1 hypothetical protein [Stieleria sedimenti]
MDNDAATRLQQAALDDQFAEWVQTGVWRFAENFTIPVGRLYTDVTRHWHEHGGFVANGHPFDEGTVGGNESPLDVKHVLREAFSGKDENQEAIYQEAVEWSRNGARCLSCGRDLNNKLIDLATLNDDSLKTLVALYLKGLGDSVLLVAKPPDWLDWLIGDDRVRAKLGWLVLLYADPNDPRFDRIDLVIDKVLAKWKKDSATFRRGEDEVESEQAENSAAKDDGSYSKKPMTPQQITIKASGILVDRLQKGNPVQSQSELAKLVDCSKSAKALKNAWKPYVSAGGGKHKKPSREPFHDGLGEGEGILKELTHAEQIELLAKEQEADERSSIYPNRIDP